MCGVYFHRVIVIVIGMCGESFCYEKENVRGFE